MFPRIEEVFAFIGQNHSSHLRRLLARGFCEAGFFSAMKKIYGADMRILDQGVFGNDHEMWEPLAEASAIKKCGIITALNSLSSRYADEPSILSYSAAVNAQPRSRGETTIVASGCSNISRPLALWRCLGEAVERFSSFNFSDEKCHVAALGDMKAAALDPRLVAGFSEKQLQWTHAEHRIDEKSVFQWVEGRSLTSRNKAWIPAQLVYGNYQRLPSEPIIRSYVTTGAAVYYGSKEEAIINGILEVLERDAFIISWLNRLRLPSLDINAFGNPSLRDMISRVERYGLKIRILDMTTDIPIPTALCVIVDPQGCGSITLSSKTHFDYEEAVLGAVEGAIKVRQFIRSAFEGRSADGGVTGGKEAPVGLRARALFWVGRNPFSDADFYFQGDVSAKPAAGDGTQWAAMSTAKRLEGLIDLLRRHGLEVFSVDITPNVLAKTSWHAVSIVIPQAAHMWLDERFPSYGCKRISDAPCRMGLREGPTLEDDLYSLPHPFL